MPALLRVFRWRRGPPVGGRPVAPTAGVVKWYLQDGAAARSSGALKGVPFVSASVDARPRGQTDASPRVAPVTLGFVAVFWIVGVASSSLFEGPAPGWKAEVAATAHFWPDHWPAVLASAL